jgi:hypothetical protein
MAAQEQDLADIFDLNEAPGLPQAETAGAAPSGSLAPTPTPSPASRREIDLEDLLATEPEPQQEVDLNQLLAEDATSMYDWRTPAPDKQTYFNNKALIADLQKQGALPPKPGMMDAVGSMIETVADGINTMLWKYDPENEGKTSWQNMEDLASLMGPVPGMPAVNRRIMGIEDRPNTANPPLAISETVRRAPATLAMSAAWTDDFYKSLRDGIMANAPKYRVKETGEFVMPSMMGVGRQASFGGAGQNVYDIVANYKQQGKTLQVATETDLEDYEYEQFIGKREQNRALDEVLSGEGTVLGLQAPNRPEIVTEVLSKAAAGFTDTAFGTKYLQALNAQQSLPMEGQSMVAQMFLDPGVVATGMLAPARFGLSAAMKGATAATLEKTAAAARMVAGTADAAKKAKFVTRAKRMGTILGSAGLANVMGTQSESDEVRQAVGALNAGLGLWGMVAGGGWILRGYGKYGGKAAYLLRESAGPGNAIDRGARAAVAANPSVPLRYKDPLVRPSAYTAMESTPARLSKDMSLSPRARKLFGNLADWRAVQAVRGTSAAASGAVKGALANVPFSEPLRAAGEEDAANLMLGLGAVIGAPMGVAGRVSGTAGRRAMAANSDVGRMLAEVQGMGETVPRKRAPQADPDGEVMRTLTEVELSGGDVSAMVNNLSPDRLNEFSAVQGYFRDTTDFVPLNAADFEANRKALNPNNSGPIFLHAPDGERPRVFVNVEDTGSIKAGDLSRAFLQSESLPDRQVAAMINSVETLYTPEQIAARERAIAKAEIDARYAKLGVKGGATDAEIDLRLAMLRSQSQTEFGDANIWSRQAIAAEDLSSGIVDWNRMRRGLPKGNNPITHLENVLGAQARGLMISGVRIDPETGRPLDTPDSIKRTNPAAADDPAVAQGLKNYTEGYNKMRRDPANETPTTEPVSPERAAAIELSMTDAPMRARQIMDLAGGPDGPDLAPTDPNFGWRQEGNRRVLAGMRLPDRIRLANHWRNELPKIDEIQRYMDSGEYVVMRWDTLSDSADVTKREGPQAITREGRILRWNATTGRKREKYKGGGNLNVQIADYTTLRNNVLTVIDKKHPALDPNSGGPGYSIAGIMADVDVYLGNRRAGADLGTGLTPERRRIAEGLVEGRRGNIFEGVLKTDGIVREARIELVETIQPTGRTGHNMVGNNADGTFTQPPPKPMPDMGSDVVPPSTRFRPNLRGQSGAIDLSIITDLFGEGPKGRAKAAPDADYMAAVQRGDENAARKIMEDAIKPSLFFEHVTKGKVRPFWHHKRTAEDFTTFRTPAWFSKNKEYVQELKGPIDYKPTDLEASQPYFLTPDIIDKGSFKDHRVLSIDGVDLARTAWKGKTWEEKLPFIELPDRDQVYPFHDWQYGEGVLEQPGVLDAIKEQGYQIIHIKERGFDTYAVLDPNIIKPADAVLRDGAGNVIPPSQRLGKQ